MSCSSCFNFLPQKSLDLETVEALNSDNIVEATASKANRLNTPFRACSVCSATASHGPSTEGPYAPVGLLLEIWNKRRVRVKLFLVFRKLKTSVPHPPKSYSYDRRVGNDVDPSLLRSTIVDLGEGWDLVHFVDVENLERSRFSAGGILRFPQTVEDLVL